MRKYIYAFILVAVAVLPIAGTAWAANDGSSSFTASAVEMIRKIVNSFQDSLASVPPTSQLSQVTGGGMCSDGIKNQDEANIDCGGVCPACQTSVSQYGVTWYFDKGYRVGTFANGDYWVRGPVTITSITPAFSSGRNGWEVNPSVGNSHGFDANCRNAAYEASKVPSLPYTSAPGKVESIVKTISSGVAQACVKTAAVLTVVTSVPADNGATVFRPPYVGTDKPFYSVNSLRKDLLPSYPPVANTPSLDSVKNNFQMMWLEHLLYSPQRDIRPADALQNYSPKNSFINSGILRLMLNDSYESKKPALINVVQHGLDQLHATMNGWVIHQADGHDPNHRAIEAFAATMLDIEAGKTALRNADKFHEDYFVLAGKNGPVWGDPSTSESAYWGYVNSGSGSRSAKDPYGFIDGGDPTQSGYELITIQTHKASILTTLLMPSLQTAWNPTEWQQTKQYVDRFVTSGFKFSPDPCAPVSQGGGSDSTKPGQCKLDPDLTPGSTFSSFSCQAGKVCGRFPANDKTYIDGAGVGYPADPFATEMWKAYRNATPPPTDTTAPSVPMNLTATAVSSTQINLSWTASTDNVGVSGYKIYRNGTQVATVAGTSFQNTGLTASTAYSYTVAAYDAAGNTSAQSGAKNVTTLAEADSQAPSVAITTPTSGSSVGGVISLEASASDNVGVAGVQFKFDGLNLGAEDAFAPYTLSVDTVSATEGSHTLAAVARDAAGNTATATNVSITVVNDVTPPVGNIKTVKKDGTGNYTSVQSCVNAMVAGDTCLVYPGIYNETVNVAKSGSAGKPLVISSQTKHGAQINAVDLNGSYIVVDGFKFVDSSGTAIDIGGNYNEVKNNSISKCRNYGIRIPDKSTYDGNKILDNSIYQSHGGMSLGGKNTLIEGNIVERLYQWGAWDSDYIRIFGQNQTLRNNKLFGTVKTEVKTSAYTAHVDCFQSYDDGGEIFQGITIERNFCSNFDQGIMAQANTYKTASGMTIRNNVFAHAWAWGVNVQNVKDVYVYNNTFSDMDSYGVAILNSSTATVKNNIFYDVAYRYGYMKDPVTSSQTAGVILASGNNLLYNPGRTISSGNAGDIINQDPKFVGISSDELGLLSDSPAIDKGSVISGFSADINGAARPQGAAWDIGAYEFAGSVSPTDTIAPTINITAPLGGSTATDMVTLSANATDNIGVAGVQFMIDGINIGAEDTASPYTMIWDSKTVANGSHVVTALARDAAGNTTVATGININVNNLVTDTQAPSVPSGLTAAAVSSSQINLSWTASTDNVGVIGYKIYRNGAFVTNVTSGTSFQNTSGLSPATTYSYTVAAYDTAGNASAQSAADSATTLADASTISITVNAPSSGSVIDTSKFNMGATASDNVVGVQFYVDGQPFKTEDIALAYSRTWDFTVDPYTNGPHTITARARTASGETKMSDEISISINYNVADTQDPAVSVSSPIDGSTVSSNITLSANATDNIGVTGVQFMIDGVSVGVEDTASPYTMIWDSKTVANGSHVVTARARDAAGNQKISGGINIVVNNVVPDTTAPTVPAGLTAAAVSSSQINLSWTESTDNIGVSGYKVYRNGTQITTTSGTALEDSGLSPATTYSYTVAAYDTAGNASAQSAAKSATTQAEITPIVVDVVAPSQGSVISSKFTMTAGVSSNVKSVQFYVDGVAFSSEDVVTPFSRTWDFAINPPVAGPHTITALAKDGLGNSKMSNPVGITIETQADDTQAPIVKLVTASFGVSRTLKVAADVQDNVGVKSVQFLLDGNQIGSLDTVSPYEVTLKISDYKDGEHQLLVRAYDAAGNVGMASGAINKKGLLWWR